MTKPHVVLIGATGFIGTQVAAALSTAGYSLSLVSRRRERRKQTLLLPDCHVVQGNVHDRDALAELIAGANVVVSMAGILNENSKGDFDRVHHQLPKNIAAACAAAGVSRLLHLGALKAEDNAPSQYLRTKAAGAQAVMAAESDTLHVTSFHPSVVFGPGDDFFNRFASLLTAIPVMFPLACPRARFAPVYVQDVAQAMVNSITDKTTYGQSYNLCGPNQYQLIDLVRYVAEVTRQERKIVGLSSGLSRLQAQVMGLAPVKLFTVDNYNSMKVDSTSEGDDLARLGVSATGVEAIVPLYLGERGKQRGLDRFRARAARD